MITKVQKGHADEVKRKRIMRIKEAINFEIGTKEEPKVLLKNQGRNILEKIKEM